MVYNDITHLFNIWAFKSISQQNILAYFIYAGHNVTTFSSKLKQLLVLTNAKTK